MWRKAEICASLSSLVILLVTSEPALAQGPQLPAGQTVTYLDQGWTEAEKQWWYTTSQGSRLLPLSWITALELKDSSDAVLSEANIRKLGYLPSMTAGGLPVGFVVDQGSAPDHSPEPWLGMTCAACHTGELNYGSTRLRIEGAPTLADFQSLMESLLQSLVATKSDSQKRERFVTAVLGADASAETRTKLLADLDRQIAWFTRLEKKNAAPIRYGHGRLDAQGHILNKMALSVGAAEPLLDFPSDAPASYPFLWTTPQHRPVVQWNGIAPQPLFEETFNGKTYAMGAMVRNATELIGVFGPVDVDREPDKIGYASSLRLENMIDLEALIVRLKSPRWPEALPPIDGNLAGDGQAAYLKYKCNDCHTVLNPATEPPATVDIQMVGLNEIGTDIWLACNTYVHESKSGRLEGPGFPATVPTFNILVELGFGVVNRAQSAAPSQPAINPKRNLRNEPPLTRFSAPARAAEKPVLDDPVKASQAERCREDSDSGVAGGILAYKARPLNGIWATAPYLHNGSVPTLYEMLLPPGKRTTAFWVGGTQFDPKDVGFKSGPGDGPFELRVRDANGKVIPGNDNAGHDYGTAEMTDQERRALVEYLKTL